MSRTTSTRSGKAKAIKFPQMQMTMMRRRFLVVEPGISHQATSAPAHPQPNNPFPELTAGELYGIFFNHLRADPEIRDKAIRILQTIEAEQQEKAAAHVCPTCLRPFGSDDAKQAKGRKPKG